MSSDGFDDKNWSAPQRDERGRFAKGSSGNYAGRPRKPKPVPLSALQALQRELAQEITVNGPDGATRLKKRDVLITSAINDALRATGKERWGILERLAKMGALDPAPEELENNYEPIWNDAECQLIKDLAQQFSPNRKPRRWNIALARWEEDC